MIVRFAIILTLLTASCACAQSLGPADADALFAQANEVYAQADELFDDDPAGARALYLQSATMYDRLITDFEIDNFMLHVNRGNALLRAGDVGRAVAAYRRAERLRPDDSTVRAGLAAARAQTSTEVTPSATQRAADALLWWRGYVPRGVLFAFGACAYVLLWCFGFANLIDRRAWARRTAVRGGRCRPARIACA